VHQCSLLHAYRTNYIRYLLGRHVASHKSSTQEHALDHSSHRASRWGLQARTSLWILPALRMKADSQALTSWLLYAGELSDRHACTAHALQRGLAVSLAHHPPRLSFSRSDSSCNERIHTNIPANVITRMEFISSGCERESDGNRPGVQPVGRGSQALLRILPDGRLEEVDAPEELLEHEITAITVTPVNAILVAPDRLAARIGH
jgi:hypothetical protein